jgi:hypothetical protein
MPEMNEPAREATGGEVEEEAPFAVALFYQSEVAEMAGARGLTLTPQYLDRLCEEMTDGLAAAMIECGWRFIEQRLREEGDHHGARAVDVGPAS